MARRTCDSGYVTITGDELARIAARQACGDGAEAASGPDAPEDASAPGVVLRPARAAAEAAAGLRPPVPNAVEAADMSFYTDTGSVSRAASAPAAHAAPKPAAAGDRAHAAFACGAESPVVLVAARGHMAKKLLQVAAGAGFSTCAVYTGDHAREPYLRHAQQTVCLGESYSGALMSNAHALLEAARSCGAAAILLCEESLPLAKVDSFLARAQARGISVYRALCADAPELGWVQCTSDKPAPPEESWRTCPKCRLAFDAASLAKSCYRCPACGAYLRLSSTERIAELLDADSFVEWDIVVPETDPLDFPGYPEKLRATREKSGFFEGVRTGVGCIAGLKVAIGVMDSTFFMGSMGSVVGEKLSRLFDGATKADLPVVVFTASGGARMQEGLVSLMQMAKVSCAVERHANAGLLYISVLTDPTTGGVTASFAMQGDVVLAEPGALIGFAGQRVIRDTIRQELPEGFQTAEFALAHGLIDAIVPREQLRSTIAHLVGLHASAAAAPKPGDRGLLVSYTSICESLQRGAGAYNTVAYEGMVAPPVSRRGASRRIGGRLRDAWGSLGARAERTGALSGRRLRRAVFSGAFDAEDGALLDGEHDDPPASAAPAAVSAASAENPAWESVQLARNTHRPTSCAYIEAMVDGFIELHGDRSFGDDAAVVGGIGWIAGRPVTVIALEKGIDLKQRIRRNFGCPQPEGYRKSLRLMRQAEKFGRPVVCFVDTQGAFCGTEAEERGQGNAIADNLLALAGLRVPVVSVLLGEGGSGGALALALADRVAMQEHAVYSVLSPEGFASILWKDRTRAPEAAAVMKMSAAEALELGIVDAVISEGPKPAHVNPDDAIVNVHAYVSQALRELADVPPDRLLAARHERFARF